MEADYALSTAFDQLLASFSADDYHESPRGARNKRVSHPKDAVEVARVRYESSQRNAEVVRLSEELERERRSAFEKEGHVAALKEIVRRSSTPVDNPSDCDWCCRALTAREDECRVLLGELHLMIESNGTDQAQLGPLLKVHKTLWQHLRGAFELSPEFLQSPGGRPTTAMVLRFRDMLLKQRYFCLKSVNQYMESVCAYMRRAVGIETKRVPKFRSDVAVGSVAPPAKILRPERRERDVLLLELAFANKSINSLSTEVTELNTKKCDAEKQIAELKAANKSINSLRTEVTELNTKNCDAEKQIAELKAANKSINSLRTEVTELNTKNCDAEKQIAHIEKQLSATAEQLRESTSRHTVVEGERAGLHRRVERLREVVKAMTNQLRALSKTSAGTNCYEPKVTREELHEQLHAELHEEERDEALRSDVSEVSHYIEGHWGDHTVMESRAVPLSRSSDDSEGWSDEMEGLLMDIKQLDRDG